MFLQGVKMRVAFIVGCMMSPEMYVCLHLFWLDLQQGKKQLSEYKYIVWRTLVIAHACWSTNLQKSSFPWIFSHLHICFLYIQLKT